MRLTKRVAVLSVAALLTGCATIKQESFTLSNGKVVDYVHGKVDADGQTGVFRDAYIDGAPVVSHFGSGQSLWGQVLQGSAGSALLAGGMVGAAAVLRPTRINDADTTNLSNGQSQAQSQEAASESSSVSSSEANPITIQSTTASSSSKSSAKNLNSNTNINANSNTNTTKVSDIGGDNYNGGVPGCQKAKNGC
jgi:hypothetical protein